MPRRKKAQPEPFEHFNYDDLTIEVRNRATRLIGRGLHNRQAFEEIADKILEFVSTDYFRKYSNNKPESILTCRRPRYLSDASSFARTCELRGIPRENSALRKRYYQQIIDWITMIEAAFAVELQTYLPPARNEPGIAALPHRTY